MLSWLSLLVVLAVLAAVVVVPRLGGATAYTVLTGSMRPGLPPGSLAVVKPVDPATLAIGDVVTYQMASGEPAVITHRVVGMGYTSGGELQLTTQGDANNSPDEVAVRPVQVRGKLWYSLPLLGYANSAISGEAHIWLLWLVVGALLAYAAFMLVAAGVERWRKAVAA